MTTFVIHVQHLGIRFVIYVQHLGIRFSVDLRQRYSFVGYRNFIKDPIMDDLLLFPAPARLPYHQNC